MPNTLTTPTTPASFAADPRLQRVIKLCAALCCKAANGENEDRARREPARFYLPRYIGSKGWFGLRLDQGRIDWHEVQNLLELSYTLAAPATLARQVQQSRRQSGQ